MWGSSARKIPEKGVIMKDLTVKLTSKLLLITLLLSGVVILNDWTAGSARAALKYHRDDISGFETWSGANIHYIDDVFNVTNSNTLTIQAGAKVFMDSSHGGAFAGSIVVKNGGTLDIQGTLEDPVYITANSTDPAPGDYRGIVVENGGTVNMQYTYIGNATTGVEICGSGSQITNSRINETSDFAVNFTGEGTSTISHSIMNDTGSGMNASGGIRVGSNAAITDCEIFNSLDTGIYVVDGSPTITGTHVHDTTGNGMLITGSSTPSITDCNISDTWGPNIRVEGDRREVTIANSTVGNWTGGPPQKTIDIGADSTHRVNLTVLNCSYINDTFRVDDFGNLTVEWYVNVYVDNRIEDPVPNATVNLRNRADDGMDNGTTDASGGACWLRGREFSYNASGFIIDKYYRIEVIHPEYVTEYSALWIDGFNNTTVHLTDAAVPSFGTHWHSSITTGDMVTLSTNVTDNIAIDKVRLDFSVNEGARKNWSITNQTGTSWSININIPSGATTLDYFFWANDTTNNRKKSQNYSGEVIDNDTPVIGILWNSTLTTGDPGYFSVNITDNIAVDDVLFEISVNNGGKTNYSVDNRSGDSWHINYSVPSNAQSIEYVFWANDTSDNWIGSNSNVPMIQDDDGPVLGSLWNSTPTTGDNATFSLNITDNVGIDSLKFDFTVNGNENWNWTVSNRTGNSWWINVIVPGYAETLEYYFWGSDAANNAVVTSNTSMNVSDDDAPSFGLSWNSQLITGDEAFFSINISDNVEVDKVFFDFTTNEQDHHNWSVTNNSAGSWNISFSIPLDTEKIDLRFWANDTSGNEAFSANNTLMVDDDVSPQFGDLWHSTLSTGDIAVLSANATDNVGITAVMLDFTINGQDRFNWSVTNSTGDSWDITITLPSDAASMEYYFWTRDAAGNQDMTNNFTRAVNDNDAPVFGSLWDHRLSPGGTGHFSANITDNIAVDQVKFDFTVNGTERYNWSVSNQTGNSWKIDVGIPADGEIIEYSFWVKDAKNNWARSENVSIGVGDNEPPLFGAVWVSPLTTGEAGFFSVNITDNISVRSVMFDYTINGYLRSNLSVRNRTGDSWNISVVVPNNTTSLEYHFWANDTSANMNRTTNLTPAVVDNDHPLLGEITSTPLMTGESAVFSLNITDNIGVDGLFFDFTVNGTVRYNWTVNNRTEDTWTITITVPVHATELEYYFWGRDANNNWVRTSNETRPVLDNIAPTFGIMWNGSVTTGDAAIFSVNITENIEVSFVFFDFLINGLNNFNWSVTNTTGTSWYISIILPSNATTIQFSFWVNDTSGNVNSTIPDLLQVADDDKPVLGSGWHGSVTTGDQVLFSMNITDNVAIGSVQFDFLINGVSRWNLTVVNNTGNSWHVTVTIPSDASSIEYNFWVNDTSANWAKVAVDTLAVIDNDDPSLVDTWNSALTTGDPAVFSINISDNVAIDTVWFDFALDGGQSRNLSVTNQSGTVWDITLMIPGDATGISYGFSVNDTSDNWMSTTKYVESVSDDDLPVFSNLGHGTLSTGESVTFFINITDNIEVDEVYLEHRINGGFLHNMSVDNNTDNTWQITIVMPSNALSIQWKFSASDSSGNWANTSSEVRMVTDNDAPTFGILWKGDITTGDMVHFSANVTDNIELVSIRFLVSVDGGPYDNLTVNNKSADSWSVKLTIPSHATSLRYRFQANDTSNNWISSALASHNVIDNDFPSLVDRIENFTTGDTCVLKINADDNVDIRSVSGYYSYNYSDETKDDSYFIVCLEKRGGNVPNEAETWSFSVEVPGDAVTLSVFFRVWDGTNFAYLYKQGMTPSMLTALSGPIIMNVSDNDAPTYVRDPVFNLTYNTTEKVVITLDVFDNSFTFGDVNITLNFSGERSEVNIMDPLYPAATYRYENVTDINWAGIVNFTINVTDSSGNFLLMPEAGHYTYTVLDSISPEINSTDGNFTVGTKDPFTITCKALDNIKVTSVELFIRVGSYREWRYMLMESTGLPNSYQLGSATLRTEMGVDKSDGSSLYYYIVVTDRAGNSVTSGTVWEPYMITAIDNTRSVANLTSASGDFTVGTGDDFIIYLNGSDNIGLANATIFLRRTGTNAWHSALMDMQLFENGRKGEFEMSYARLNELFGEEFSTANGTGLEYYIELRDVSSGPPTSVPPTRVPEVEYFSIFTQDTNAPTLSNIIFDPSRPETGDILTVIIYVEDNMDGAVDINGSIYYNWTTAGGPNRRGNTRGNVSFIWDGTSLKASLEGEHAVPEDATMLEYYVVIRDANGNSFTGPVVTMKVDDDIAPSVGDLKIGGKSVKLKRQDWEMDIMAGTPTDMVITISDNVDPPGRIVAVIEYTNVTDETEFSKNLTFYNRLVFRDFKATIELPDLSQGYVYYRLVVTDSSGNRKISERVHIMNVSTNDPDGDGVPNDEEPQYESLNPDGSSKGFNGSRLDFMLDETEWKDSDGDGVGDNADHLPFDPIAAVDTDGDGYPDMLLPNRTIEESTTGITHLDAFPNDPAASLDTDGDGAPDQWNTGRSVVDSTSIPPLKLDYAPTNEYIIDVPTPTVNEQSDEKLNNIFIIVLVVIFLIILVLLLLIYRRRSKETDEEKEERERRKTEKKELKALAKEEKKGKKGDRKKKGKDKKKPAAKGKDKKKGKPAPVGGPKVPSKAKKAEEKADEDTGEAKDEFKGASMESEPGPDFDDDEIDIDAMLSEAMLSKDDSVAEMVKSPVTEPEPEPRPEVEAEEAFQPPWAMAEEIPSEPESPSFPDEELKQIPLEPTPVAVEDEPEAEPEEEMDLDMDIDMDLANLDMGFGDELDIDIDEIEVTGDDLAEEVPEPAEEEETGLSEDDIEIMIMGDDEIGDEDEEAALSDMEKMLKELGE